MSPETRLLRGPENAIFRQVYRDILYIRVELEHEQRVRPFAELRQRPEIQIVPGRQRAVSFIVAEGGHVDHHLAAGLAVRLQASQQILGHIDHVQLVQL